jgi:tetratricopeptide (TPR) repeat protein
LKARAFDTAHICATLLFAVSCLAFLVPFLAAAQTPKFEEQALVGPFTGYDYFTAYLNPELKSYLTLAENRHASEQVWRLYRDGIYNEPLADCKYILDRFPNHPRGLQLMGEIAKATNQTSLPIPYFERALKLFPQYAREVVPWAS